MPSLRDAIEAVIVDGTKRNYDQNSASGGMLIDRYVGCGGARKRVARKKKGGMLIDRQVGCGARKRRVAARRVGGAKSNYMDFVKAWHAAHPNYSWAEAVRAASADYHKAAKSVANKVGLGVMAAGARAGVRRKSGSKAAVRRKRAGVLAAGAKRPVRRVRR